MKLQALVVSSILVLSAASAGWSQTPRPELTRDPFARPVTQPSPETRPTTTIQKPKVVKVIKPTVKPVTTVKQEPVADAVLDKVVLMGLVQGSRGNTALVLVDGQMHAVQAGDQIDGIQVVAVDRDGIRVSHGSHQVAVLLHPPQESLKKKNLTPQASGILG